MDQKNAWNELYGKRGRQWRGVPEMEFPFGDGGRILDLGCGNGKTSIALIECRYSVCGIDFSENAVEYCSSNIPEMTAVLSSVTSVPFDDETFDGVAAVHVMEHLSDNETEVMIREIYRVLKHGGKVLAISFGNDDMRSKNGSVTEGFRIRGNGIRYRYYSEEDIRDMFHGFREICVASDIKRTKFDGIRVRIRGVFEKQ